MSPEGEYEGEAVELGERIRRRDVVLVEVGEEVEQVEVDNRASGIPPVF